ncbi:hypothetical protein [Paracoccus litorisediminis]|uniref:Uncharacterized protein n=1 Tax=Paracoccus litorisediminis TaxID=2006130 RepID=A0A844HU80_9RHOB|nr:hypothetical protein [Paracoccus litorisediminis]MTH61131.1 hypothetical protein [Paracoccus litorisediminis]
MTEEEILNRRRRPSLTVREMEKIVESLCYFHDEHGRMSEAQELVGMFAEMIAEEKDPEQRRLIDAYRNGVETQDGEMELDLDAEVSLGDDPGAYVMVWKWVTSSEADVCDECNGSLDDGEGYDGLCGSCADAAEEEVA